MPYIPDRILAVSLATLTIIWPRNCCATKAAGCNSAHQPPHVLATFDCPRVSLWEHFDFLGRIITRTIPNPPKNDGVQLFGAIAQGPFLTTAQRPRSLNAHAKFRE
jgi:hypothetical protein